MSLETEKGTIRILRRFHVKVIERARAALPPASRVSATQLDSVVGIQLSIANPVTNS